MILGSRDNDVKKHPAAIAEDKWFMSDQGIGSSDPVTLGASMEQEEFLRNRLHSAFQAGYDAAKELKQKEMDILAKKLADMIVYATQLEQAE